LAQLQGDPQFVADPMVRADGLEQVRDLVLSHPVDAALLSENPWFAMEVESKLVGEPQKAPSSSVQTRGPKPDAQH
jgi:hypothetical protein